MKLSNQFICAGEAYCQLDKRVAAPYFRRTFFYQGQKNVEITITGLGFYELYINGLRITKGYLSPYISNTSQLVYYDHYRIEDYLVIGKNVIGIWLGNGMQNAYGGYVWDFDKTPHRSSPKLALACEMEGELIFEADDIFLTHSSPILEDDLRLGEVYDANQEVTGWNLPEYDDSTWLPARKTESPLGEKRLCKVLPIQSWKEISPVQIWEEEDGYVYDFGENLSGIVRLQVDGKRGQEIHLLYGEMLKDGRFFWENNSFLRPEYKGMRPYRQEDTYICKGERAEIYEPTFTYHGFQYVKVIGITKEQAKRSLLTFVV